MEKYVPGSAKPKGVKVGSGILALLGSDSRRSRFDPFRVVDGAKLFEIPIPPPGVLPKDHKGLAQDSAITASVGWSASVIGSAFAEGVEFLGYPYLSALTQRPEYRVVSETIAGEMTRKWIKFQAVGDIDKNDKIKELEDEFNRLRVQDNFRRIAEQDGFFGRAHLYIDLGDGTDREELKIPIGNGQNDLSKLKVKKGSLKALRPVEAVWSYPNNYNSYDPLDGAWYKPTHWFVMGKELHVSRFLTFVGREVPDLLKPAYSFGGLSLSQMIKPYVDNWLYIRQSVSDLVNAFSVMGLKTNLSETLTPGGEQLFNRIALFNLTRNNKGMMLIDNDTEEFFNVAVPLGTLDALQAQAQEHMAAIARIPLVKLLGIEPAGLNASSEGEIRTFYDSILEYQTSFFTPHLTTVMHFAMLNIWGEVDEEITFEYEQLWSLDEKAEAEVREIDARTGQIHIDTGVISPEEERERVAKQKDTRYPGLNVEDLPNLKEEIQEGLAPKGAGAAVTAILGEGKEGEGGEEKPEPDEEERDQPEPKPPGMAEKDDEEEPDEHREAAE